MPHQKLPPETEIGPDGKLIELLSPAVHEWLHSLPLFEDKNQHTVRAYSQGLRRIISIAEIDPRAFAADSLNQAELTDLVRDMRFMTKADGITPLFQMATINQSLSALQSFYHFCVRDHLPGHEEVPDVLRLKRVAKLRPPEPQTDHYLPAEIRDLFEEAASEGDTQHRIRWPTRDLAMCSFLAILGVRAAELIAANVGWITQERLDDLGPRLDGAWLFWVQGKRERVRSIPLSQELLEVHDRWQEERVARFGPALPSDPLFVTNTEERFNYQRLKYWLRLLNREAGLRDRSLHTLRHTAGIQLANDGVSLNVIQALLGHVGVATAGIYTALASAHLSDVVRETQANALLGQTLREEKT